MKCENCKQYKSAPLWNKCNLTGIECFQTIDNCYLVDDEGNDTGEYDRFWGDDQWVVEFHPPASEYVNNMENCLHLWRPINKELPTPASILV